MSINLSSAAVVIGALRVHHLQMIHLKYQPLPGFLRKQLNLNMPSAADFRNDFKGQ